MEKNYPSMLSLRLSKKLHEKLREAADLNEMSASDYLRAMLADRLGD